MHIWRSNEEYSKSSCSFPFCLYGTRGSVGINGFLPGNTDPKFYTEDSDARTVKHLKGRPELCFGEWVSPVRYDFFCQERSYMIHDTGVTE